MEEASNKEQQSKVPVDPRTEKNLDVSAKDLSVDIFTYERYREYLRDKFNELKRTKRQFSHRYFAKKAGLSSSNFAHMVINDKRNLSKETVLKFSNALGLNAKEHEYFENMVFMNQSKTLKEKNFYFRKMLKHRQIKSIKKLEQLEFEYCSNWFIPVIREMVELKEFSSDPHWISRKIKPNISVSEARYALKVLKDLHFIVEREGLLVKREKSLSTGEEVRNLALKNLHQVLIELGKESIERYAPEQRDISSLTLSLTMRQFREIKKKIIDFRKEILEFITEETKAEVIYQFNFQLFPLIETEATEEISSRD